ncbi:hypothetical protein AMS68_005795 [Peltaster fructicola]|uniref:SH3 domain-containing protein n=1 Tax=Peltaster fructicola TaxID=286661 RepID=A0A6H0Y0A9_9PEZI|nr:hypothetical protein AMS68_005795 [Peltaster fructicola]
MKSMQRKWGGYKKRSADEADVSIILADFKQADELLDRLIADLKSWRDGWQQILKMQYETADALATLYKDIATPDAAESSHVPAETPQQYMQKCLGLQKLHEESRDDLSKEIALINDKLIGKAEAAKLHAKPLKKTIKHRENMKLDFERHLGRVESARGKELRSQKDEMNLAKNEADLAQAKITYQTADDHVKENFPGVTDAIYSLIPYLVTTTIMLQTTLVGQLYTVLDAYTRYQRMPNPAPNDAEIVAAWENEFTALRKELESGLKTISNGKAVHMGMALPEKQTSSTFGRLMGRKPPPPPPSSQPARSPRPSIGSRPSISPRPSIQWTEEEEAAPPQPPRPAVSPNLASTTPVEKPRSISYGQAPSYGQPPTYDLKPTALVPQWQQRRPSWSDQQSNGGASPPSRYATPLNGSSPMLSPTPSTNIEYFASRRTSTASSIASSAAAIGAKKKPPPPVPIKRIASSPAQYVTALYDFEGQSSGDLPFREGDRIRVVKKTDSVDDWWTGELKGITGSFPANYVQI